MMPFVSWYTSCVRTQLAIRQDVLIFWKPVNFIAETQGCHALKQVLVGLSRAVKKNCRINFQCRRKNVIMVVYGKGDCGPCPPVFQKSGRERLLREIAPTS